MQQFEGNPDDFSSQGQSKADEGLLVKFYLKERPDKAQTLEEGRPCFKEVEYVSIMVPGQRDGAARPATYADKQRFPRHYAAFKERSEVPMEGTPLTEWPGVSRSQAEELAFFNVKTVEQLAQMSDANAQKFHGINILKKKAVEYLEQAAGEAGIEQMRIALEERDTKISEQATLIEQLAARLEVLEE